MQKLKLIRIALYSEMLLSYNYTIVLYSETLLNYTTRMGQYSHKFCYKNNLQHILATNRYNFDTNLVNQLGVVNS